MICPNNELDDYSDFCAVRVICVPNALAGKRLDVVLQQLLPEFSRSRLQSWIKSGRVSIEEHTVGTKTRIDGGERLTVLTAPTEEELAFQAEPMALDVIYEDQALLVLNKPAGLVVHPGSGNWNGTLLNGLLAYAPALRGVPRAGIVHRLDKDTSGLMVVAKTVQAQTGLVRQLHDRFVQRHYLALVHGQLQKPGGVEQPIGRHPRDRVKMAVVNTGKPARTDYLIRENFRRFTLVECQLKTGRTHQIRVHMQYIGHPLAADPVYKGKVQRFPAPIEQALQVFNRQALHAYRLGLHHPTTNAWLTWEIPLDPAMHALLEVIRDTDVDILD